MILSFLPIPALKADGGKEGGKKAIDFSTKELGLTVGAFIVEGQTLMDHCDLEKKWDLVKGWEYYVKTEQNIGQSGYNSWLFVPHNERRNVLSLPLRS